MQCEICGIEIKGKPLYIRIEGSELNACSNCSRFGTPVERRAPVARATMATTTKPLAEKQRDVFDQMVDVIIVPNYGEIIRKEREKRGWTQEELAKRILEKANVVKKIERQELMLEEEVRKKLEKVLEIKLVQPAELGVEIKKRSSPRELTLGDIATIKKKK
ncbi:MAG: multiprotein bridging factor aMBF1 [Methanocellales archaeon]